MSPPAGERTAQIESIVEFILHRSDPGGKTWTSRFPHALQRWSPSARGRRGVAASDPAAGFKSPAPIDKRLRHLRLL